MRAPDGHDGEEAFKVRIAFSLPITASMKKLPRAFEVTGGRIERAGRVDRRSDLWELTVHPHGDEDVTLALAEGRACGSGGVPCAKTPDGDGRIPLSNSLTVTVTGPQGDASDVRLTARIDHAPEEHDGSSRFEVRVRFSEPIANSFRHVPEAATASGGTVTGAKRYEGRSDMWLLRVLPDGHGPVTVAIAGGGTCGEDHPAVLCTSDGRALSHPLSVTVPGPATISVADATANEAGNAIQSAGPSMPAVVLGLSGTPAAGDDVLVVTDERKAREVAAFRHGKERDVKLAKQQATKLDDVFEQMSDTGTVRIQLVVKADVQGSVEALKDALEAISNESVKVTVVASGVGGITESDIQLAVASDAIVLGFNVRADAAARGAIKESAVDIRYYRVIYEAIDDVKAAASGMLSPEIRERIVGLAEVREVFRSPKLGNVAGCMVVDGHVKRASPIRVLRDNVVIYEGRA